MKQLLITLLAILSLSIFGCDAPKIVTNRDVIRFAPVIYNQEDMQKVVNALKANTVFYEADGKCFAAVFYYTGEAYNSVSITQIDKCPK